MLAGPPADRVVQRVGRKRGKDVVEGGGRGRGIDLLRLAPERTHRLELLLVEAPGELGKGGHPAVAGKPRRNRHRQHARQQVAPALPVAELGHLAQELEQAAQPRRRQRLGARPAVPLGRRLDPAQGLGGIVTKFVHEDLLRLAVVMPARRAAGLAAIAAGQAQRAPVRRPITGPREAPDIYKTFRQMNRIAVNRPHVPGQAPQTQPQHPRRQIRNRTRRQNDKANLLRDQVKPPELLLRAPADPAVARRQLERTRLPANQRKPGRAQRRNMTQTLAEQTVKRQVVMRRNQLVPATAFLGAPRRTHRHRAKIDPPDPVSAAFP